MVFELEKLFVDVFAPQSGDGKIAGRWQINGTGR